MCVSRQITMLEMKTATFNRRVKNFFTHIDPRKPEVPFEACNKTVIYAGHILNYAYTLSNMGVTNDWINQLCDLQIQGENTRPPTRRRLGLLGISPLFMTTELGILCFVTIYQLNMLFRRGCTDEKFRLV